MNTSSADRPTVYLLTLAALDCYADDHEWGGRVITAEVDLNKYFVTGRGPCDADQALAFAEDCVSQLEGFPAEARRMTYDLAVSVLAEYPEAAAVLDALLVPAALDDAEAGPSLGPGGPAAGSADTQDGPS